MLIGGNESRKINDSSEAKLGQERSLQILTVVSTPIKEKSFLLYELLCTLNHAPKTGDERFYSGTGLTSKLSSNRNNIVSQ